jgi:hypothetical protein
MPQGKAESLLIPAQRTALTALTGASGGDI